MSQLPSMPVWVADFFSKTDHLSNEEQWAYLKLMMKTWARNCRPMPDNDTDIARLLDMGVKRWRKIRPRLEPFFDLSARTWVQPHLENVFREATQRKEKIVSSARLGGIAKSNKIKDIVLPSAAERQCQSKSYIEERKKSSPNGEPKESRPTRLPVAFVMPPEWLDDGQLARQRHDLPDIDLLLQSELFCNYWWSKGPAATKNDWHKTWTNWCLNAHNAAPLGGNDHGRKQSPGEKLFEGAYRAAVAFDERQRARVEIVEPLLDGERSGSNAGGANSGLARRPH